MQIFRTDRGQASPSTIIFINFHLTTNYLEPFKGEIKLKYYGVLFGLYVLFTIGIYHILIVKLEAKFGTWPWIGFLILGILCLYISIISNNIGWSMLWGYNAFVNLWSVKEMFDQQKRSKTNAA